MKLVLVTLTSILTVVSAFFIIMATPSYGQDFFQKWIVSERLNTEEVPTIETDEMVEKDSNILVED